MSTFKTPVGPQPGRVYWRRRLLVGLGILAVIVIIILLVVQPRAKKPTAGHTPTPSISATTSTGKTGACSPSDISVNAITDATTYAAGVNPQLSLTITNTGSTECTFKVGSDVQVYSITSGSDKIWSSKDCQKDAVAAVKTLEPGKPLTSTPFAWNRTRSSTTTCASTNLPQVTAGGASYHLAVTVNGVTSTKTVQFILK
jgi:hypothetical protein